MPDCRTAPVLQEVLAIVVSHLPYAALPCFRTTCRVAQELVDAASNGWVRGHAPCTPTHDTVHQ